MVTQFTEKTVHEQVDEFIGKLEETEKIAKDQSNAMSSKGSEDNIGGLGLNEMVGEEEDGQTKVGIINLFVT